MKYHQGHQFIDNGLYIITNVTETEVEFLDITQHSFSYLRFTKMNKETFEERYKHCFCEVEHFKADIKIAEYVPSTVNIEDLF
jgi:hypothetical protein